MSRSICDLRSSRQAMQWMRAIRNTARIARRYEARSLKVASESHTAQDERLRWGRVMRIRAFVPGLERDGAPPSSGGESRRDSFAISRGRRSAEEMTHLCSF